MNLKIKSGSGTTGNTTGFYSVQNQQKRKALFAANTPTRELPSFIKREEEKLSRLRDVNTRFLQHAEKDVFGSPHNHSPSESPGHSSTLAKTYKKQESRGTHLVVLCKQ